MFEEASFKMSDMVRKIVVRTRRDNRLRVLYNRTVPNDSVKGLEFKIQKSKQFGKCYTLRFDKAILASGIKSVRIQKS